MRKIKNDITIHGKIDKIFLVPEAPQFRGIYGELAGQKMKYQRRELVSGLSTECSSCKLQNFAVISKYNVTMSRYLCLTFNMLRKRLNFKSSEMKPVEFTVDR